jgi:hypothetical protein
VRVLVDHGRGSPPVDTLRTVTPSATHSSCQCSEYLSWIADLEGHLSLMKRQARTAMDQASKSYGLMKQMSILENKLLGSFAQVTHLKECESFLVDFIESACEQLKCKFLVDFPEILVVFLVIVF